MSVDCHVPCTSAMSDKRLTRRNALQYFAYSTAATSTTFLSSRGRANPRRTRSCDVCIIGAGAAGVFSAIRLRDRGRRVAVVERSGRVGGHCETFTDPTTGTNADIGVVVFPDAPIVADFFGRFGITVSNRPTASPIPPLTVDFETGRAVITNDPSPAEVGAALLSYIVILTNEFAFLNAPGYVLPRPVPSDLLLPFGQFLRSRGLLPGLNPILDFLQGFGPQLDIPTVYAMKNIDANVAQNILANSFVSPDTPGCQALYDAAAQELGDDVLLERKVYSVRRRRSRRVRVLVDGPSGLEEILAEKLIVAFPPTLSNLLRFDLNHAEFDLFRRFKRNFYWTSVAEITGLPPFVQVRNRSASTTSNQPVLPGVYSLNPTPAPNLYDVKYGATSYLPNRVVRRRIQRDVERLSEAVGVPVRLQRFRVFKSHSPYALQVSPRDVAEGFYDRLNRLQGQRDTFYLGAAIDTHNSFGIWKQAAQLLDSIEQT